MKKKKKTKKKTKKKKTKQNKKMCDFHNTKMEKRMLILILNVYNFIQSSPGKTTTTGSVPLNSSESTSQ